MSSITREAVLAMPLADIFAAIKDPKTSVEMQNMLRDRAVAARISQLMLEQKQREEEVDRQIAIATPPSTEELAAQAAAVAAAPDTAAQPVVEPAVAPVEPAPVTPAPERKKIVREYQVRDEEGNPIGRPTHLEAWTLEEMAEKLQVAHENAARAFHRLKKQKTTFKPEPKTILTPEQIKAAAEAALQEKDPAKAEEVVRATVDSYYTERERKLAEQEAHEAGRAISNEFMRRHLNDYRPCEANQKLINEYLTEHRMDFTLDNLEACFADLMEQGVLVKVERPLTPKPAESVNIPATATPAPSANSTPVASEPAVVTPSETAQPAAPASQPTVEETVTTPVAAPIAQPAARRPGVNGGIAPGTLSAKRPDVVDPSVARKEFMRELKVMKPEVMKAKLKNDPQFVKQLESYGIRIR